MLKNAVLQLRKQLTRIICLTAVITAFSSTVWAQAPGGINYQAVARNAGGNLVANQAVNLQISIRETTTNGNVVYQETHSATTNQYGLFTLVIGQGTTTDNFSAIGWGNDLHFLQVEVDLDNDLVYDISSTTQLWSVPYALYSGSTIGSNDNDTTNELITNVQVANDSLFITEGDSTFSVDLSVLSGGSLDNDTTNELQSISLSNDTIFLSDNGGFIVLPPQIFIDNDTTNELITSAVINNDTLTITEAGVDFDIDLTPYVNALDNDADSTNEIQVLTISNDTITLSDGGFVVLPPSTSLDNDTTNEIQTLSISNDTIFLTNGGFAVLPPTAVNNDNDSTNELITSAVITNDTLTITEAGIDFEIDLKPYVNALDNDADSTNEIQVLSISNDTITLTDGGFVVLPASTSLDNDTTNEIQTLSISNDTIFLTNGGFAILPPTSINNDNDSTNELITSAVITNDTLTITEAGIDFEIDLKPYVNALDNDADSTNEIQVLSISNDTITLTDGGFVVLPASTSLDNDTTNEIQTLVDLE